MHPDDEPVFKRSRWGTNHYYANPRNSVGRVLIVLALLLTGTMLVLMANRAGPFAPEPTPEPTTSPGYDTTWPYAPGTTGPSPSSTPSAP
ncbi:hypothetical protein ABT084_02515 [Streptomyces sp. NPDC002138]|uniref:hypothetical protein n=1 Tax=Streptomyces sp. NPDC002138 TaxID=3154410 RepID=UPI00331BE5AB